MPRSAAPADGTSPSPRRARIAILPRTRLGWWGLAASAIGFASWVVLPLITVTFRQKYPITNTWVMPAIGTVILDLAAVFNVLCVWRWRERSVLNGAAMALTVLAGLGVTLIVVGEGLGGQ